MNHTFIAIVYLEESVQVTYAGVNYNHALKSVEKAFDEENAFVDGFIEVWEEGKKVSDYQVKLQYEEA
ncbi:hypothetical protein [Bacillus gaemokensis]|uniref:Uncharacterized protein n=1 Tax=Bacillus gaemokensis TaxID=574375 RepID=A0A073K7A7_9BACI|nr:hypothetical protein [Bacillus gaemokensis]KEK22411.1 hypothetical protein BAGA_19200 [Bacillus gaemokensis]KYG25924.1 hypothetical protein AZF08_18030 [Bacillus gaemokensis]